MIKIIFTTACSAWPTPTVSTKTTSKLAASHRNIVSRVVRVTPPNVHLFGDDLAF